MENVPERYKCCNCESNCTDLLNKRIVIENGKKTIFAIYKCRICGCCFEERVYWEI